MLSAEIHGRYVPEARFFEDYLTSAVFGHLRYIGPGPFWETLLELAVSIPMGDIPLTASNYISSRVGRTLSTYSQLDVFFWPHHPKGSPDIVLCFRGPDASSALVIVEAKLESGKSGHDEQDQLARYLGICDSLSQLQPRVPTDSVCVVVYLTAMDSRSDLMDTLRVLGNRPSDYERLYRLQWQDFVVAIENTAIPKSGIEQLILRDVAAFLKRRDLDYFRGMPLYPDLPLLPSEYGSLLLDERIFETVDIDTDLDQILERWNV